MVQIIPRPRIVTKHYLLSIQKKSCTIEIYFDNVLQIAKLKKKRMNQLIEWKEEEGWMVGLNLSLSLTYNLPCIDNLAFGLSPVGYVG